MVALINNAPCKRKLIALTDIKHKNKCDTDLSELAIGVKTLRTQDTLDLRHFGAGAEVSVRHFGTGAEVSGHFGIGAEMSVRHFGTEVSLV